VIAAAGAIALFKRVKPNRRRQPGGGGGHLRLQPEGVERRRLLPGQRIILRPTSVPWQARGVAIARMKTKRLHRRSRGGPPKYFPEQLVRYTNSWLKNKMLSASDSR